MPGTDTGACAQRLPRWAELPDLELYMDQVLSLTERYLACCPGPEQKGLTASMVNNYVKIGALPPPIRKKYSRAHLARLLMICMLKPVLPIAAVQKLMETGIRQSSEEAFYDSFCALFEQSAAALPADGAGPEAILRAALRSRAEQALSLRLLALLEQA